MSVKRDKIKKSLRKKGYWGRNPKEIRRLKNRIEEVSISKLRPWADNPRFNEDSVPRVAELIQEHGFAGVIIATPDGVIRAGHTRFAAMKLLGMKTIWVHWKNFPSKQAAEDYALADNKANEWADWDHTKLAKLFKNRQKKDLALLERLTGFQQTEIMWQGKGALDVSELEDIEVEDATFVIRVDKILAVDRDVVLESVQEALKGTGYDAKLY